MVSDGSLLFMTTVWLALVHGLWISFVFGSFQMGFEVDLDFLSKMLKNASLCVVFYFLDSKHFRNCFPHALMENAQAMLIHLGKCL